MKSTDFLQSAIDVQAERGRQYDSPEGERSMGRTVAAFNAITGRDLTEAEGWLLLQVLKDVRQWQNPGQYHHDSALDGVAYASLKAEALHAEGEQERVPSEKTRSALEQARELRRQHDADMTDWRNWQVGDLVEVVQENDEAVPVGTVCAVAGVENNRYCGPYPVNILHDGETMWPGAVDNDGGCTGTHPFRWHSRPAK